VGAILFSNQFGILSETDNARSLLNIIMEG